MSLFFQEYEGDFDIDIWHIDPIIVDLECNFVYLYFYLVT